METTMMTVATFDTKELIWRKSIEMSTEEFKKLPLAAKDSEIRIQNGNWVVERKEKK